MHHFFYKLFNEIPDKDLCSLCNNCHKKVHFSNKYRFVGNINGRYSIRVMKMRKHNIKMKKFIFTP